MTYPRSLVAGVGVGAGLTYLFDPDRGARRRARVRDAVAHTANLMARGIARTGRDARHRLYGTVASFRTAVRHPAVDDDVIVERVRAKLGRLVSHPHAIHVAASNGTVTLQGPILTREARRLIRAAGCVGGVRNVVDSLERHDHASHVPSLQGGRQPGGDRLDVLQNQWAPATRAVVGTAGAALAVAGAFRRDRSGTAAALIGTGLFARAVANVPIHRLIGLGSRRGAVDVQKTINVNARIEEVYAFWSSYENFPHFMSRVLEVRTGADRRLSHWTVAGPAGVPVSFDAEMTRAIPDSLIAWKTLPGAPVAHAGVVRFDPGPDGGTRVQVRLSYNPPAGWFGHGVAAIFGVDPKSSMDADLARMKTLIETGRAPHDAARRTGS